MNEVKEKKVRCQMRDCGCSAKQTKEYLALAEADNTEDRIYLLKRRRKEALDELHTLSRQIDCIDFCIHELETNQSKEGKI